MFPLCLCISNARIVCSVSVLTASAKAGYEWFYAFMKQHSDISLCKPEPLSVARAMGMNETVKNAWFDEVEAAWGLHGGGACMPSQRPTSYPASRLLQLLLLLHNALSWCGRVSILAEPSVQPCNMVTGPHCDGQLCALLTSTTSPVCTQTAQLAYKRSHNVTVTFVKWLKQRLQQTAMQR